MVRHDYLRFWSRLAAASAVAIVVSAVSSCSDDPHDNGGGARGGSGGRDGSGGHDARADTGGGAVSGDGGSSGSDASRGAADATSGLDSGTDALLEAGSDSDTRDAAIESSADASAADATETIDVTEEPSRNDADMDGGITIDASLDVTLEPDAPMHDSSLLDISQEPSDGSPLSDARDESQQDAPEDADDTGLPGVTCWYLRRTSGEPLCEQTSFVETNVQFWFDGPFNDRDAVLTTNSQAVAYLVFTQSLYPTDASRTQYIYNRETFLGAFRDGDIITFSANASRGGAECLRPGYGDVDLIEIRCSGKTRVLNPLVDAGLPSN